MTRPIRRLHLAFLVSMVVGVGGLGGCGGDDDPITPVVDAAPPCDPATQTGCAAGEKCTWIRTAATATEQIGQRGCVAAGTKVVNDACAYGATGAATGFDDCAAGFICLAPADEDQATGSCREICNETADAGSLGACEENWACGGYVSFFQNETDETALAGVCDPTCDPLAQTRDYDGAAGCGTIEGQRQLGCFGNIPVQAGDIAAFTCAVAVGVGVHGEDARNPPGDLGDVYRNGCAPGHIVGLVSSSADDAIPICSQLCQPVETHSGAPEGAAGAAAHACPAGSECRYWWWFDESGFLTEYSDSLGVCIAFANYQYDADRDGTADTVLPSCTTLPNTDSTDPEPGETPTSPNTLEEHLEFGCGPAPVEKARRGQATAAPFRAPKGAHPEFAVPR
jgi:hypothetical protein